MNIFVPSSCFFPFYILISQSLYLFLFFSPSSSLFSSFVLLLSFFFCSFHFFKFCIFLFVAVLTSSFPYFSFLSLTSVSIHSFLVYAIHLPLSGACLWSHWAHTLNVERHTVHGSTEFTFLCHMSVNTKNAWLSQCVARASEDVREELPTSLKLYNQIFPQYYPHLISSSLWKENTWYYVFFQLM
jgi:hypothetical protein